METYTKLANSEGYRISLMEGDEELGHVYLYVLQNDLHDRPFGLLEDVFVAEHSRNLGIGSRLIDSSISEARSHGCYKLICTSRHGRERLHELYKRKGFREHGLEFRHDLPDQVLIKDHN